MELRKEIASISCQVSYFRQDLHTRLMWMSVIIPSCLECSGKFCLASWDGLLYRRGFYAPYPWQMTLAVASLPEAEGIFLHRSPFAWTLCQNGCVSTFHSERTGSLPEDSGWDNLLLLPQWPKAISSYKRRIQRGIWDFVLFRQWSRYPCNKDYSQSCPLLHPQTFWYVISGDHIKD